MISVLSSCISKVLRFLFFDKIGHDMADVYLNKIKLDDCTLVLFH